MHVWFRNSSCIFAWESYSCDEFTLHSYQSSTSLRFCAIIVSYWHLISSRICFRSGPGQELTSTLTSPVDWFLRQLISCKDNPDQLVWKEKKTWVEFSGKWEQHATVSEPLRPGAHFWQSQQLSLMLLLQYTPSSGGETTADFQAKLHSEHSWGKETVGVYWFVWWLITAN